MLMNIVKDIYENIIKEYRITDQTSTKEESKEDLSKIIRRIHRKMRKNVRDF